MNFDISTEHVAGWSIVKVSGELDMATAGTLQQQLSTQFQIDGHRVAVDLAGLSFLDSSGLGVLLSGLKTSMAGDGAFALLSPGPPALRVFEAAGVLRFLPIYSSLDDLPESGSGSF
ncbi:MAG TPA: STAS domain-containing protein [Actinomycetota bacterium]|nr:STAS domain-containing protein [Actinomycetota bacterium]